MQACRYKAFISYSHRDEQWAVWLHRALENYRPPRRLVGQTTSAGVIPPRLTPIFRDRDELPTATDLGVAISNALQESACQIVICSPTAAVSRWVNEEILAFKRMGREDRIFCVIVAGEPNASDIAGQEARECFPPALRYKLDAGGQLGSERAEPIAADAREGKDGRQGAKLKIIAGMLGVGFDALRQREAVRAHRRMAIIATASVGGMLITSGLSVMALLARNEADRQRIRAEQESETSRQVSNFIVGLFSVSDPSESLGNSITAREILDRGARQIGYELDDQPVVKAALLDTIGSVYSSLGLYDSAAALLDSGLLLRTRVLGEQHPLVARSRSNLGRVQGLKAQYTAAAVNYEAAIGSLRADRKADPKELARSLQGLAEVRAFEADYAGAEKLLREALQLLRVPADAESLDIAKVLDQLGLNLSEQSRYEEAEPTLREALAMYRRLLPGGVHPELNNSINDLAVFLYGVGRYDEAESLFRESLNINRRLLGEQHPDVATSLNNLAFVLQDNGKTAEAEAQYRTALDIRRKTLGDLHPLTGQSYNNLAFLMHDQGRLSQALEYQRNALAIARQAYPGDHPETAVALQNLGSWLLDSGAVAEAGPLLVEALAVSERSFPADHPDIARTRSAYAYYLLKAGHFEEALVEASAADEALTRALGEQHWRVAWARAVKGAALLSLRRPREAELLLTASYAILKEQGMRAVYPTNATRQYLYALYSELRRPQDAARFRSSQNQRTTIAAKN